MFLSAADVFPGTGLKKFEIKKLSPPIDLLTFTLLAPSASLVLGYDLSSSSRFDFFDKLEVGSRNGIALGHSYIGVSS